MHPQEATVVSPEGRTIVVSPRQGGRPAFVFEPRDNTAPSAIYEGFRAQRRELTNQLDELEVKDSAFSRTCSPKKPRRKLSPPPVRQPARGIS